VREIHIEKVFNVWRNKKIDRENNKIKLLGNRKNNKT
jgi:hypothetical protein